jgi:probable rRNA maturation factor
MRILNHQYRMLDRTTDVLSFPQYENPPLPPFSKGGRGGITELRNSKSSVILGDIIINVHMAKRQAEENGLTLNEEIKRLLIHGLLHLIGCDHEMGVHEERKMKRLSNRLLRELAED